MINFSYYSINFCQKRKVQANAKSISEKYDPLDDSGSGFPIEPPVGTAQSRFAHTGVHLNAFGSSRSHKSKMEDLQHAPSLTHSSLRVSNDPQLKTQRSYRPQSGAPDFSEISGSLAARSTGSSRYNRLDAVELSEKQALDRASSTYKKDDTIVGSKESAMVSLILSVFFSF